MVKHRLQQLKRTIQVINPGSIKVLCNIRVIILCRVYSTTKFAFWADSTETIMCLTWNNMIRKPMHGLFSIQCMLENFQFPDRQALHAWREASFMYLAERPFPTTAPVTAFAKIFTCMTFQRTLGPKV